MVIAAALSLTLGSAAHAQGTFQFLNYPSADAQPAAAAANEIRNLLLTDETDADTELAHWRWRGFYYRPFAYSWYRPFYYRPFAYSWYRPFYSFYYYSPPLYYYTPSYYYWWGPCNLTDAVAAAPAVPAVIRPDQDQAAPPPPQPQPAPQYQPPSQFGTYPYDGGPRNPVPMPKGTSQPSPAPDAKPAPRPTVPREGIPVSIPAPTVQFRYPAYGETPTRTQFAEDRPVVRK
jgi:hypothetical protein